MKLVVRVGKKLGRFLVRLLLLLATAWAFGALYFDFPVFHDVVAGLFVVGVVTALFLLRGFWKQTACAFALCGLVLAWWLTLSPRADRDWQPDVAELPWAEIQGDEVTLHNVRHFDYRTATDYTPRWETRTVHLSQLTGVDMFINYWGSPWMAHPIVSFQFADAPPVCFSIETRKEVGEKYSALGGLYRQYELYVVAADERDVIRLRTSIRPGEESYLYRTLIIPEKARERFMEYVTTLNELREQPRWYNAVTTNCTTAIRGQHPAGKRPPWDWRILVNGKADSLLYERGYIETGGLPFAELREKALVNPAAKSADTSPDFSRLIRAGLPGMDSGKN
ncbi:MAG TPA: hypothetical protein DIT64_11145 [Verrucomicrobiales bacterium]|nr:hypothetical protein [Verrucomicrobiales bacterium]